MPDFIREFSPDELDKFRSIERSIIKLKAVQDRLWFLNECQVFGVFPKCVKLNRTVSINVPLSTNEFSQRALAENIINARDKKKELQTLIEENKSILMSSLSVEMQPIISDHLESIGKQNNTQIMGKLTRLVKDNTRCSNFLNVSNVQFSELETSILNLGPKHVFRDLVKVPDIVAYFEKASWVLRANDLDSPVVTSSLDLLKEENIKANYRNKPSKVVQNLIKKLKDSSIIITKADKETKLVAVNKSDYYDGLYKLLGDRTKFQKYVPPPRGRGRPSTKNAFEIAGELVKNFVDSVPGLTTVVKCPLSTRQPFLYGLAKTHKNKTPMPFRPVLSATGCYNFSLAKFICKVISPFCYSKYCLKNVDEFLVKIKDFRRNVPPNATVTQCSYDVESLFTNIPLDKTIEKLVEKIFRDIGRSEYNFDGVIFDKDSLTRALELCAKDQLFLFNGEIWKQIDGNSMGSPLGPPLANFYVSYLEDNFIDFNSDISPNFYCRYVDDIYSVFIDNDKSSEFLNHLNTVSVPLKFTIEEMTENKLNFIGLQLSNDLSICIKDKGPFYNLVSPESFVPEQYLYSSVNCLTHRAVSFIDRPQDLKIELSKIVDSASKVGLSLKRVNKLIEKKCNKLNVESDVIAENSASDDAKKFVLLPFINKNLASKAKNLFHSLKVKVSFCTVRSLYTCVRPREPSIEGKYGPSNVIYKFNCASCDRNYIGYTTRPINVRATEHCVKTSVLSRAHRGEECNLNLNKESFSVLSSGRSVFDLRVKEAFLIKTLKPELNTKYERIKQADSDRYQKQNSVS